MEVSPNHLLLQIESNNFKLSCIRFWKGKDAFLFSRNVLHCASKEVVSLGRGSKDSCMDGEWGWLDERMNGTLKIWQKYDVCNEIATLLNYVSHTVVSSSCSTWSYSDMATQKMMAVTSSKQWIHFFRSDLCPPTSKSLKLRFLKEKCTSTMPVVFTLVLRMSCSVGW